MIKKPNYFDFNQLQVGLSREFKVCLTKENIESFCQLTGDFHPLHADKNYAISCGFRDVIAHGALITALSSRLIGMKLPGRSAIILSQSSEYKKPVFPGDELSFVGEILKIRKALSIILIGINIINQNEECIGYVEFTVKHREEA